MDKLELIDKLCFITSEQSKLIRAQSEVIAHSIAIDQMAKKELKSAEKKIDDALDVIELACREYI